MCINALNEKAAKGNQKKKIIKRNNVQKIKGNQRWTEESYLLDQFFFMKK